MSIYHTCAVCGVTRADGGQHSLDWGQEMLRHKNHGKIYSFNGFKQGSHSEQYLHLQPALYRR